MLKCVGTLITWSYMSGGRSRRGCPRQVLLYSQRGFFFILNMMDVWTYEVVWIYEDVWTHEANMKGEMTE